MSANHEEMRQVDAVPGKSILLGRQGEHLAAAVRFDLTEWQQLYGGGAVQLLHQRSMDEAPYPCAVTVSGTDAWWTVTAADCAFAGRGQCELQYHVDGSIVKSAVYDTRVDAALGEAAEEPPEAQQAWVDAVLQAGTNAVESERAAKRWAVQAAGSAGIAPQIVVTTDAGAEVSCSCGETMLEQTTAADGRCIFDLGGYGEWTVTASLNGKSVSRAVFVTEVRQYEETVHTTGTVSTEKLDGVAYRVGLIDPESGACIAPDKLKLMAELISADSNINEQTQKVYFHYGNEHYVVSVGDYIYFGIDNTKAVEPLPRDFVIIGFNHDRGVDGYKAGITFQMRTVLVTDYAMNNTDTNTTGWQDCELRKTTLPAILANMPEKWTKHMKQVRKPCGAGESNTADTLFILSQYEILGESAEYGSLAGDSSAHRRYAYYAAGNSPQKGQGYWLRSVRTGTKTHFRCYLEKGTCGSDLASVKKGIPLAFCM